MTTTPITQAAELARRLVPGQFREASDDARGWIMDCWGTLPDGRATNLLNWVDTWAIVAANYEGGVEQFVQDGQYAL